MTQEQLLKYSLSIELKNLELERLVYFDSLTKIYSRRWYDDKIIDLGMNHAQTEVTFLFIDVDNFKRCNDRYGHDIGDQVLSKIAAIIQFIVRKQDFVARYGGDEFVVGIPSCDNEVSMAVAERLRYVIEHYRFDIQGTEIRLTLSIGIASGLCSDILDVCISADEAMYRSKKNGRNRITV